MVITMQARLSQQAMRFGHTQSVPRPLSHQVHSDKSVEQQTTPTQAWNEELTSSPNYKLSEVGQLPLWAKRKPEDSSSVMSTSPSQIQLNSSKPRGKWAQRGQFDAETLDLRNIVDSQTQPHQIIISNNTPTSGYNSGSVTNYFSEDSSIDSGMENRRDHIQHHFLAPKISMDHNKMHSLNSESNTEHDGDVEDISDGERTSSDHGMIYYPGTHSSTPT